MSKLDELIQELCPNGVPYHLLQELCISLKKGTLKQSELVEEKAYPVINSARNIYGYYPEYNNEKNAFTLASRGEYAGYISYLNVRFFAGGLCYPYTSKDENKALTKFIFYYLKDKQNLIMDSLVARGSIPALNKKDIDQFLVPTPPLPVQQEIVRILDTFTDLKAELEAELEARKKQYEYYRNEMLRFDGETHISPKINRMIQELCPNGVEYQKISEAYVRLKGTPITAGKMKEIQKPNGDVKVFAGGKTVIDAFEKDIPHSNITRVPAVLVQSRGVIDVIFYEFPFTFKNEMWAYTSNNRTSVKYLYYFLKSIVLRLRDAASGMGALPQIPLTVTEDLRIPIPPLPVQQEIVRILDSFDTLANDIKQGLPAEIESRQKQYEYYRDKLLSFKELEL